MSNTVIKDVLKIFNKGWNRQVILYGPPGTSKTYSSTIIAAAMIAGVTYEESDNEANFEDKLKKKLESELNKEPEGKSAYELASEYLKEKSEYKLVQFHPSYSYEDFVRGIKVDAVGDKISYTPESKIIEKFCKDNAQAEKMILVIDEINRAPLASVLGELIYGLEYRGEKISTPYVVIGEDDKEVDLIIPDNLYIIGTMNTADRSIGSMDYAVRRRFAFIPVNSSAEMIENSWEDKAVGSKAKALYEAFMDPKAGIFAEKYAADPEMDLEDIKIGHTYFLGRKGEGIDYLKFRIQYQIMPIYREYIKDGLMKKEGLVRFENILNEIMLDSMNQNADSEAEIRSAYLAGLKNN